MTDASVLQLVGAWGFGFLLGWYLYFVNRYRTDAVNLSGVAALVGSIGGAAVLTLFPAGTDLFGAYGLGLFCGFFGYFVILVVLVIRSKSFTVDWFLDGRRRVPGEGEYIPDGTRTTGAPMDTRHEVRG
jgi:hypothetical protein